MASNSLHVVAVGLIASAFCCGMSQDSDPRIKAVRIEARDHLLQLWRDAIPCKIGEASLREQLEFCHNEIWSGEVLPTRTQDETSWLIDLSDKIGNEIWGEAGWLKRQQEL